jgi:hypothetical protein
MRNNINTDWRHIIESSENLLNMAANSHWEDMPLASTQRDKLIRDFFNLYPVVSGNAEKSQQRLQDILAIDKKIIALTMRAQSDLDGEMNEFRKSANAAQAYNSCP